LSVWATLENAFDSLSKNIGQFGVQMYLCHCISNINVISTVRIDLLYYSIRN